MTRLWDVFSKFGEFLAPLVEFSSKFKGFLSIVSFFVLVGIFLVFFLFSQGALDNVILNFQRLTPSQFLLFAIFALTMIFSTLFLLILLSYKESRVRTNEQCALTVLVHEHGNATEPIHGALVTLVLDEAVSQRTSERGATAFAFDKKWRDRECQVNAKHDAYEPRKSIKVKLGGHERILFGLKKANQQGFEPINPNSSRGGSLFICCVPNDVEKARALATSLQAHGFHLATFASVHQQMSPTLSIKTELAIHRADFVVVLGSKDTEQSLGMDNLVSFAQEQGKTIIPVQLEPNAQRIVDIRESQQIDLYKNYDAERERLCGLLDRLSAANHFTADSPTIFTPETLKPLPNTNPFVFGSAVKEDIFVGRQAILNTIRGRIGRELQSVSLVANRRMGRTSLLNYITRRYDRLFPPTHTWVVVYMDMMDVRTRTSAGIMRIIRKGIAKQLGRDLWDERHDGQLGAMAEAFEELFEDQVRLVLCLDEWEIVMARKELDGLIEQLRASGSMSYLGMIVSTTHELRDLKESAELCSPFYNIFATISVGLMPEHEWQDLVRRAFSRSGREAHPRSMALIGELAGGHPYLTQLAGSLIWEAERNGWSEAQLRHDYAYEASLMFTAIWQRQNETQKNVVRKILGIPPTGNTTRAVWEGLKRRGVITESAELFCTPFADFVKSCEAR